MHRRFVLFLFLTWVMAAPRPLAAAEALAAVAANFAKPVERLIADYEAASGHRIRATLGSTGKLYAQIAHGGPFDLFLAADQARPERLVAEELAVPDSRFTYAVGRLALIRSDGGQVGANLLRKADFRRLAIANPKLAPYGLAAEQTLAGLGLLDSLRGKLVFGENIGQTILMVTTGNAEAGLVALSLVSEPSDARSYWLVPADLHEPIRQDAVLLARAKGNPAAEGFLAYLRSPEGREAIQRYGYDTD